MFEKNRRRIYLIEKSFQLGFILKFCGLVAVAGLVTIAILYSFALRSNTVAFMNSRVVVKTTADFLLPILVQTVVIVMIIVSLATIAVTLFFSHKIAGPLYHLRKAMKDLEAGDFSVDFRVRHLDQLQELADTFNNMIKKVKGEIAGIKHKADLLEGHLREIGEGEVNESKRPTLGEAKKVSRELKQAAGYFKV
jgi:methyl-accepting chemotaxis protein